MWLISRHSAFSFQLLAALLVFCVLACKTESVNQQWLYLSTNINKQAFQALLFPTYVLPLSRGRVQAGRWDRDALQGRKSWRYCGQAGHMLHTTRNALLSHTAPCWAMMQPAELPSPILLSCIPFWTMLHLLSNAAPYWATLYPPSCAAPYWAKVHPAEIHSTPYELSHPYWATWHPTELRWTL